MNNEILEVLDKHLKMYPLMQEEDIYKLVHQSFFGPAHYINDVSWANKYIKVEAESCEDENKDIIYIGGGYYRYPLINDEEYLDSVCDAFVKSANTFNENKDGFRELLDLVSKHITKKELKEKLIKLIREMENFDFPAISHSTVYRQNYQPHYRVIHEKYIKGIAPIIKK